MENSNFIEMYNIESESLLKSPFTDRISVKRWLYIFPYFSKWDIIYIRYIFMYIYKYIILYMYLLIHYILIYKYIIYALYIYKHILYICVYVYIVV